MRTAKWALGLIVLAALSASASLRADDEKKVIAQWKADIKIALKTNTEGGYATFGKKVNDLRDKEIDKWIATANGLYLAKEISKNDVINIATAVAVHNPNKTIPEKTMRDWLIDEITAPKK